MSFATTKHVAMPLNIRNEEADAPAGELVARQHIPEADAIKLARHNELRREDGALPLRERLRPLQQRVKDLPATGLEADEDFFNSLSGEIDVSQAVRKHPGTLQR